MSACVRLRALRLFREALRASHRWNGSVEEALYIRSEARRLVRETDGIEDVRELEKKLSEGRKRLDIALHYGIAYPRLHHKPNSGGMTLERPVDVPHLPGVHAEEEEEEEEEEGWEVNEGTKDALRRARKRMDAKKDGKHG